MFFSSCFLSHFGKSRDYILPVNNDMCVSASKQTTFIPVHVANIDQYAPTPEKKPRDGNMEFAHQWCKGNRLGIPPPPFRYMIHDETVDDSMYQKPLESISDSMELKAVEMTPGIVECIDFSASANSLALFSSPNEVMFENQSSVARTPMTPVIFAPNLKATHFGSRQSCEKNTGCCMPSFSWFRQKQSDPMPPRDYDPNYLDQIIMSQGHQYHRDRGTWFLAIEPEDENNSYITFHSEEGCMGSFDSVETKNNFGSTFCLFRMLSRKA